MVSFKKRKQVNSDGIHLLASILVCFSEITTISYEPDDESLKITFTLQRTMNQDSFDELARFLAESIHTYHALEGFFDSRVDFSMETHGKLSFLHMTRDIGTMSRGELSLVAAIMKSRSCFPATGPVWLWPGRKKCIIWPFLPWGQEISGFR